MKTQVIRGSGKASQVFPEIKLLAEKRGHETLGELIGEVKDGEIKS